LLKTAKLRMMMTVEFRLPALESKRQQGAAVYLWRHKTEK
jgi:hypothetical protein